MKQIEIVGRQVWVHQTTVSKQQCSDEKTCKNLLAVFCNKKSRPPVLR